MANLATRVIREEQDQMVEAIHAEMVEFTGDIVGFGFTENFFIVNERVWHEIKLDDGTLLYAFLRGTPIPSVIVVQEKEEMATWE